MWSHLEASLSGTHARLALSRLFQETTVNIAAAAELLSCCLGAALSEPAAAIVSALASHMASHVSLRSASTIESPGHTSYQLPDAALRAVCDVLVSSGRISDGSMSAAAWPLLHALGVDCVLQSGGDQRGLSEDMAAVRQIVGAVAKGVVALSPAAREPLFSTAAAPPLGLLSALQPLLAADGHAAAALAGDAHRFLTSTDIGRALASYPDGVVGSARGANSADLSWAHLLAPEEAMRLRQALWCVLRVLHSLLLDERNRTRDETNPLVCCQMAQKHDGERARLNAPVEA